MRKDIQLGRGVQRGNNTDVETCQVGTVQPGRRESAGEELSGGGSFTGKYRIQKEEQTQPFTGIE